MLPRIISTTGSAITAEDVAAVQRVVSTRLEGVQNVGAYHVTDQITGIRVEYFPFKNVAYTTPPSGANDYVSMPMPNPIPYREMRIGVVNLGEQGPSGTTVIKTYIMSSDGEVLASETKNYALNGDVSFVSGLEAHIQCIGAQDICLESESAVGIDMFFDQYSGVNVNGDTYSSGNYGIAFDHVLSAPIPEDCMIDRGNARVPPYPRPTYNNSAAHPDGGNRRTILAVLSGGTFTFYPSSSQISAPWTDYPLGSVSAAGLTSMSVLFTPEYLQAWKTYAAMPWVNNLDNVRWATRWLASISMSKSRTKAWLKKNSEEFIAALKTGFAPNTPGVTRQELQAGKLPPSWEYAVRVQYRWDYWKYPSDQYGVRVGRHTRRSILFSETSFSESVTSDTSANLSQAGVKVTQRTATLSYTIPVAQPDGTSINETRSVTVSGTLTQTMTQHVDAYGNQLALSKNESYSNWYARDGNDFSLPFGMWWATSQYIQDRRGNNIGVVLNGEIQSGYNANSATGTPGNPLLYLTYIPPYPKAYNTISATTIPDFIATWHMDSKIEYIKDGVGADNTLNDSALYGVTEIHISPVGLIADGAGVAVAGESVGIFPNDAGAIEDGTQVEIFGTAVYAFNWQDGSLTFKSWKPLRDANGNEVQAKAVTLPSGMSWSSLGSNCIVTYKGLHWPDVVDAIKLRDRDAAAGDFLYSDPAWSAIVQAIKAG